jgi:hypothetical protein
MGDTSVDLGLQVNLEQPISKLLNTTILHSGLVLPNGEVDAIADGGGNCLFKPKEIQTHCETPFPIKVHQWGILAL